MDWNADTIRSQPWYVAPSPEHLKAVRESKQLRDLRQSPVFRKAAPEHQDFFISVLETFAVVVPQATQMPIRVPFPAT